MVLECLCSMHLASVDIDRRCYRTAQIVLHHHLLLFAILCPVAIDTICMDLSKCCQFSALCVVMRTPICQERYRLSPVFGRIDLKIDRNGSEPDGR